MESTKMLSYWDYENNDESTPDKQQIFEACVKGSLNDIEDCFRYGEDVMTGYIKDGMTPLHLVAMAARDDLEPVIDMMLRNGFDVNSRTKTGEDTVLHLVVRETDIRRAFPVVLKILEFQPDLSLRNRKLRTPYDLAIAKGYFELAQTLDGRMTAHEAREFYTKRISALYGARLIDAILNSKENDVQEFLKMGADPNFVNEHKNGPIHYVVTHCSLPPHKTLTLLIQAGADVNLTDDEGDTALNLIIKSGRLRDSGDMYRCAELLVQHGALSTYKDLDGKDALALASQRNYHDIVKLLNKTRQQHIREEPSPSPEPGPSQPFIMEPAIEEQEEEREPPPAYDEEEPIQAHPPTPVVEEEEEDVEPEEQLYQLVLGDYLVRRTPPPPLTAIQEGEEEDDDDFVHPPPAPPPDPQSNLINAVQHRDPDAVAAALSDPNADPGRQDQNGLYPLHYAVLREDINEEDRQDVLQQLLQSNVDVNVKTRDKANTPLHIAAILNQTESVKQLLDTHKSNYNQKNNAGKMAYDLAKEEGNREVMAIIDRHREAVRQKMKNAAKKASICTIL